MRGVIVKFHQGYSFKTKTICHWCQARFWKEEEEIIHLYPAIEFYPLVLHPSTTLNIQIKEIFEKWK